MVRFSQITAVGPGVQTFRSLRHRNFRWFLFNASTQAMAQGMQFLILGWLALELTDSSSQLGLVIFLYGIPNSSFVIFGGILADRVDRRMVLITSQAAVSILSLTLAILTITDLVEVWQVYATAFLLGTLHALYMPARIVIVADLVEREDIMNAVTLNSAVLHTGRILGPAVAGWIIELTGTGPALLLNAGCYFVGIVFLLLMEGVVQQRAGRRETVLGDLLIGLRYFRSTPVAFTVIGIGFAFGFFAMPHIQVMPAFAKEVLRVGAGGAGLLLMAAGVGALLGNLVLASLGNFQHKNWLLLGTVLTSLLTLLIFPWSTWFWVSWVILFFIGMGSLSFASMGTTVLQLTVPSEVHGRVLSLWNIPPAMMYVGALPTTIVADLSNWTIAISGGAGLSLAVALWLGVWRPTLRHLRV